MVIGVSEIINLVAKQKKEKDKIDVLRHHICPALTTVLQGAFDDRIKWALPEGTPPYKPSELHEGHSALHAETRKMYLFVEGGSPNLKQLRRETLFVELLETVHPDDAKILVAIKDKTFPFAGITKSIVQKAFPGLVE